MTIRIEHGDCLDVMAGMEPESIDSIITDPPYHLISIVKRFGKPGSAEAKVGATGAYRRHSTGFMGKQWDGGDIAFRAETWRLAFDVLKPGGHMLVMGGTRTYHRMVCAVEDAGFEIRDTIMWLYGSGFPKSYNVSKGIDRLNGRKFDDRYELGRHIKACREAKGIARADVNARFDATAVCQHWEAQDPGNASIPTPEHWREIKEWLGCDPQFDGLIDRAGAERAVVGVAQNAMSNWSMDGKTRFGDRDITAPATDAAREWQGWGTALKPACEPIVLARKPLIGTIAANVLAHGTGALNIDGCRVHGAGSEGRAYTVKRLKPGATLNKTGGNWRPEDGPDYQGRTKDGRWPANVVHDGSPEVMEAFAVSGETARGHVPSSRGPSGIFSGSGGGLDGQAGLTEITGDSGTAARFFYTAKADKADRLGSKHPTVKPVDLMAWLIRLITPPGGTVLDPFAGSGTTAMAALREGFDCIVIEREAEYVKDIFRRVSHVQGADTPLFSSTFGEPQPDLVPTQCDTDDTEK